MEYVELFGPGLFALLVILAAGYFLLSFAPVLWPAWRAFRRSDRLPRPWLFVGVIAALAYGAMSFFLVAFGIPMELYTVFIAPQLTEARLPHGEAIVRVSGFVLDFWWVAAPVVQLLATWYLTRKLATRWERVCEAVA